MLVPVLPVSDVALDLRPRGVLVRLPLGLIAAAGVGLAAAGVARGSFGLLAGGSGLYLVSGYVWEHLAGTYGEGST